MYSIYHSQALISITDNSCNLCDKHRTKMHPDFKHTLVLGRSHILRGARAEPRSHSEHLQLPWVQRGQILPTVRRITFCCCLLPTAKQSIKLRLASLLSLCPSGPELHMCYNRSKRFPLSLWSCTSINRCIYRILGDVKKHQPSVFVLYHPISKLEEVGPNPERVKPVKLHQ